MQIHSVDTSAGVAISLAPSKIAVYKSLPRCRCRSTFSMVTVASSTKIPMASVNPPSVIRLMVSPIALSKMIELRIDKGMEMAMMQVLRQLPKNSKMSAAVRQEAITASCSTLSMAALTKMDWSNIVAMLRPSGAPLAISGILDLIFSTILSVDSGPLFMTVKSTPRSPFFLTMLSCG